MVGKRNLVAGAFHIGFVVSPCSLRQQHRQERRCYRHLGSGGPAPAAAHRNQHWPHTGNCSSLAQFMCRTDGVCRRQKSSHFAEKRVSSDHLRRASPLDCKVSPGSGVFGIESFCSYAGFRSFRCLTIVEWSVSAFLSMMTQEQSDKKRPAL